MPTNDRKPVTGQHLRLVTAVKEDDADAVEELLLERLRASGTPADAPHPLVTAAQFGLGDVTDRLLDDYVFGADAAEDASIVRSALRGGHLDLLKDLLARGCAANLSCADSLQDVIESDHADVLDFMIGRGARVGAARDIFNAVVKAAPTGKYPAKTAQLLKKLCPGPTPEEALSLLHKLRSSVPVLK